MFKRSTSAFASVVLIVLWTVPTKAEEVKRITVQQGKATVVADFVSARPDCSSNPGPQPLPALSQKPLHGRIGVQIGVTKVPATANCPARKIPSLVVFYVPPKDFVGADSFQIELDEDKDKKIVTSYQVTVQSSGSKP